MPVHLRQISRLRRTPVTAGRSFPPCAKLFLGNSHQNSHSAKIKMAADLAASHLIDFKVFLAPQVGLEPTTLRLTAECSAIELLRSAWRWIVLIYVSRGRQVRQKAGSDGFAPAAPTTTPPRKGHRRNPTLAHPHVNSMGIWTSGCRILCTGQV